ncbi:hypothetical protein BBBOND_0302200 [Babesia bigemina]|uniref:Uncharacterized protein n=1 Tax=Babesia bigemina TaxID=5866 RepID=A0A061D6L9_BABBI|nr:hypothetical protein BBBOND_0302200 [Babesia bigemina]CDR96316.1 hypothetical protein BBBOND_0302200 [Babesia bigemina]|eukprot:XP_012768502.1 hypothetical protein BBBOND_0302200 [Babesia bigemina]
MKLPQNSTHDGSYDESHDYYDGVNYNDKIKKQQYRRVKGKRDHASQVLLSVASATIQLSHT